MSFSIGAHCNLAEELLNQHLGKARKPQRAPESAQPALTWQVSDRLQDPAASHAAVQRITGHAASLATSEPRYQGILFIMV